MYESRELFVQFCKIGKLNVMNTFFQKNDSKLATYREKGEFGNQFVQRYEIIDKFDAERNKYVKVKKTQI